MDFRGPAQLPDFSPWYPEGWPEGTTFNEYGSGQPPAGFYHFTGRIYPLERAQTIEELAEFPWPDFTPAWRHKHLEQQVAELHAAEWFVAGGVGHIWETAWQMTRMEKLMGTWSCGRNWRPRLRSDHRRPARLPALRRGRLRRDPLR